MVFCLFLQLPNKREKPKWFDFIITIHDCSKSFLKKIIFRIQPKILLKLHSDEFQFIHSFIFLFNFLFFPLFHFFNIFTLFSFSIFFHFSQFSKLKIISCYPFSSFHHLYHFKPSRRASNHFHKSMLLNCSNLFSDSGVITMKFIQSQFIGR